MHPQAMQGKPKVPGMDDTGETPPSVFTYCCIGRAHRGKSFSPVAMWCCSTHCGQGCCKVQSGQEEREAEGKEGHRGSCKQGS